MNDRNRNESTHQTKGNGVNISRIRIFDVELSRRCNLACEFCPRHEFKEQGFMSEETFDGFMRGVALGQGDLVLFCGLGEPMLNPSFASYLALAKQRANGAAVQVITNGTMLTGENITMLLDHQIDFIIISVNGIDKQTYEKKMKGANFERTLANIDAVKAEITRREKCRTRLMATYIVSSENMHREEEIKAFWTARGLRPVPQYMHNRGGFVELDDMSPLENPAPPARPCLYFQPYTFIAWNGDVLLCCNDIHHQHLLGNIRQDAMSAIDARKRQYLKANNWPDLCADCNAPACSS